MGHHYSSYRRLSRLSVVGLFTLSTALPARAQTSTTEAGQTGPGSSRFELFGGYSFLPELDEYRVGSEAGHGWSVALAINLHRYWGLALDVDGQAWTFHGDLSSVNLAALQCPAVHGCALRGDERTRLNYFSFGPRAHLRRGSFQAFGLAGLEVQRSRYSEQDFAYVGSASDPAFMQRYGTRPDAYGSNRPIVFNTWDVPMERHGDNLVARSRLGAESSSAWGVGIGGGADLWLGTRVGIRLVQVNYSLGGFGEGPGRKLRIKTGVVIAFGRPL